MLKQHVPAGIQPNIFMVSGYDINYGSTYSNVAGRTKGDNHPSTKGETLELLAERILSDPDLEEDIRAMGWMKASKPVGNDFSDLKIRNRFRETINVFLEGTKKFIDSTGGVLKVRIESIVS